MKMVFNLRNRFKLNNYGGLRKEKVLAIYKWVVKIRQKNKMGQRNLSKEIKKKFGTTVSENTISGWIHRKTIPFANEASQFRPKIIPPKDKLVQYYYKQKLSASKIAKKYKVSTVTVINWLKKHNLQSRSHLQSMNTITIKKALAKLRYKIPPQNYRELTPAKAYILGVLCGDGYINQKQVRLEIRNDEEFIKEFSNCLEEVYGIKYTHIYYQKKNTYLLAISSMIIAKDLLRYGKFMTKSWTIPKTIIQNKDKAVISHYIKGLFDSEGTIGNYTVSLTSINKAGIESLAILLQRLKIKSKLAKYRGYYLLIISQKENIKRFRDIINFTIIRKREKLEKMYKLGW